MKGSLKDQESDMHQRRYGERMILRENLSSNHGSKNPGMILVTDQFTGNNFLAWSHVMCMALEAKGKIGFIDGSNPTLEKGTFVYQQWKQTNSLVRLWILSSMIKRISRALVYIRDARDLWLKIKT